MPALFAEIGYIVFDEIGVSVVVADAVATVLEYVAIAEILSAAQQALSPSQKSGIGAGLESNYYNSEASIRFGYGEIRVGGMQTIPPITYGPNGEYLASVLTLFGHEIDSYSDVQFDSDTIASANIAAVTGSSTDGNVTSGKYANRAFIRRYTGTQSQNVDHILTTQVSPTAFTSNFRGRGIAYAATSLVFDQNIYTNVPNQTFFCKTKKVYDPRLDSTQSGGSGSQRVGTPSTWTYSKNPALCLADFLMAVYGGEYDPSEIDWSTVMTAANVCDFTLTGANTTPDGDQARYTCNGAGLSTQGGGGQPFTDNVTLLTNAMLGRVIYANGIWSMFAGSWQTPNTVPINKSDWTSGLQIGFEQGRDKRFNEAHCWFIDPNQNWQRVECYPRINATYVTADGGESIPFETDQPFCTVEKEAQRKAEFLLRQSRNQITVSGKLPPRFQGIKSWDTVLVNYPEFGWANKSMRVAGCVNNPDGSFDVSLAEEDASVWTDLLTAEYNNPSSSVIPSTIGTTPTVPLNFSLTSLNGSLQFTWDPSSILPKGTRYRIVSSPFSLSSVNSKVQVWAGDTTHAVIIDSTNSGAYYQAQAFANSYFSGYTPSTWGVYLKGAYEPTVSSGGYSVYLSPSVMNRTMSTGLVFSLPIAAIVNSPVTPVYSWVLASSSVGMTFATISGVGSSTVTFQSSGMSPGETRAADWTCNVKDGANVVAASIRVALSCNSDTGGGGGGGGH